jgi:hypothetical protein
MDTSDKHLGTYRGFDLRQTWRTEQYDGVIAVKRVVGRRGQLFIDGPGETDVRDEIDRLLDVESLS